MLSLSVLREEGLALERRLRRRAPIGSISAIPSREVENLD
jgi:hypothetical protein